MASYRLPLVALALLSAAASIILSAVLMSANAANVNSDIFMLELDTSRVHDPVVAYAYQQMDDAGLPEDNCAVYFAKKPLQRVYFNDSTAPMSRLADAFLSYPILESVNQVLYTPEQSGAAADASFAIYVSGVNETTSSLIEPTPDMELTARNLGYNITVGANQWRSQDEKTFDAIHSFRLRIAGVATAGIGMVGLAAVAIFQGRMANYLIGTFAGILAIASICQFVSAGLVTTGLVTMSGTYAPFQFIPDAVATYRLSHTFLGLTWASAGLVLFATLLTGMAAAQPFPSKQSGPRWRGRNGSSTSIVAPMLAVDRPWPPAKDTTSVYAGHKSISSPYDHSYTIDEAAMARGVGVAVSSSEAPPPLPQRPESIASVMPPLPSQHQYQQTDDAYGSNTNRYSVVSSLGPTPVRTHF